LTPAFAGEKVKEFVLPWGKTDGLKANVTLERRVFL